MEVYTIFGSENLEVCAIFGSENQRGLMCDAILSGSKGRSPQEGREVWGPQTPQFPSVKLRNEKKETGQAKWEVKEKKTVGPKLVSFFVCQCRDST